MDYEEFLIKNNVSYEYVKLIISGKTYSEVAKQYGISISLVSEKYRRFMSVLNKFYYKYLLSIQVDAPSSWELWEFYESIPIIVAYMEKTYCVQLEQARHGLPPSAIIKYNDFPPYRKLTEQDILNLEQIILIEREQKKETFTNIGKKYRLTKEKVQKIYDYYYHKKVLKAFDLIELTTNISIEAYVYNYSRHPFKRWQIIMRDYSHLVQELID